MFRKLAVGGVGFVLLASPLLASALTVQEQIAALMAQLAQLQQQIAALSASSGLGSAATNGSISNAGATASGASGGSAMGRTNVLACTGISRSLWRGLNGTDVANLQNFLILERLLPADSATGYFGVRTEAAVQQWQAAHSIVTSGDPETTGWGVVGAQTLAAMRSSECGTLNSSPGQPSILLTSPNAGQTFSPGDTVNVLWRYVNLAGTQVNITLESANTQRHLATFVPTERGAATVTLPVSDSLGTLQPGSAILSVWVTGIKDGDPRAVKDSLYINISGSAATASIDQSSVMTDGGSFSVTGMAKNTNSVIVFLAPWNYSSYASVNNYSTLAGQLEKDGYYQASAPVSYDRWSASFSWKAGATSFLALVYDAASKQFLTSRLLAVNVASAAAPTLNFTANPTAITGGGSTTLSWSATGATSCTASGAWNEAAKVNGSTVIGYIPEASGTKIFALTCTGPGGSVSKSVTVTVTPAQTTTSGNNQTSTTNNTPASSVTTLTYTSDQYTTWLTNTYQTLLGRAPDSAGLSYYLNRLTSGAETMTQVYGDLANSPEAQTYVANSNFLSNLYQTELGRTPDTAGRDYYLEQLRTGAKTQTQITAEVHNSAEAIQYRASTGTTSSASRESQLANSLSALESALRAYLTTVGR